MEEPDFPSLFDSETSLPVADLLLEPFFTYYSNNSCFLNRFSLGQLLTCGEASIFLVCSMAALSSRFCRSVKFARYLPPKDDGSLKEGWELSISFFEGAKSLLTPLIGIPSCGSRGFERYHI